VTRSPAHCGTCLRVRARVLYTYLRAAAARQTECLVLDHAGNTARHGLPTASPHFSLFGIERAGEPLHPRGGTVGSPRRRELVVRKASLAEHVSYTLCSDDGHTVLTSAQLHARGLALPLHTQTLVYLTPGGAAGTTRACCGERTTYLPAGARWSRRWVQSLASLLLPPAPEEVRAHVANLLKKMPDNAWCSAKWVATRVVQQWGRAEAARIAVYDAHPAAALLERTPAGKRVRQLLAHMAQTHGAAPSKVVEPPPGSELLALTVVPDSGRRADAYQPAAGACGSLLTRITRDEE
jgi:hypothetical protein